MIKDSGNSGVQAENRVLKGLISAFIERIYEDKNFGQELNAV